MREGELNTAGSHDKTADIEKHKSIIHKEVIDIFKNAGLPLNDKLTEMLTEPDRMQSGRQGSGYTNLFRELSTYVNNPSKNPLELFNDVEMDTTLNDEDYNNLTTKEKIAKLHVQEKIESVNHILIHPSHKIFINMIHDIVLGSEKNIPSIELETDMEKIEKIGTCTTAEVYFFQWQGIKELKNFHGGHEGFMNVIVDEKQKPIILEKLGLGAKSCISLVPLKIGKVEIPAGSMLQAIPKENIKYENNFSIYFPKKFNASDYTFKMLRISLLALPPEVRAESFGNHYHDQIKNNYTNCEWLKIEDYRNLAEKALA
ncbi:MAG: hypothetical protein NTZ44_02325 [Candidatus Nomurabacteria bacterium]|nr:hypothetical protein [Candidatus Nomurabacteria bacterium]